MKIRKLMLSFILVPAMSLATVASNLPSNSLNITGEYQCTGFDPYAVQSYTSIMNISKVTDRIYSIRDNTLASHTNDPNRIDVFSDRETGILNANVLAITYQNRRDPAEQGVEHATFSQDGSSLYALWTQLGGNMVGTESCQKLPGHAQS